MKTRHLKTIAICLSLMLTCPMPAGAPPERAPHLDHELFVGRWLGLELTPDRFTDSPAGSTARTFTPKLVFVCDAGFATWMGAGVDVHSSLAEFFIRRIEVGAPLSSEDLGSLDLDSIFADVLPAGTSVGDSVIVATRRLSVAGQRFRVDHIVADSDEARTHALANLQTTQLQFTATKLRERRDAADRAAAQIERMRELATTAQRAAERRGDLDAHETLLDSVFEYQKLHAVYPSRVAGMISQARHAARAADLWLAWGPDSAQALASEVAAMAARLLVDAKAAQAAGEPMVPPTSLFELLPDEPPCG